MAGIKEFNAKTKLVFACFNVRNANQLVEVVNSKMKMGYSDEQKIRMADSWRGWAIRTPRHTEKLNFIQAMVSLIPVSAVVSLTTQLFIDGEYSQLYELVSTDFRTVLDKPTGFHPTNAVGHNPKFFHLSVRRGLEIKGIEDCILEDAQIDQRHIYLSAESAEFWHAFLHDRDYRQYKECVSSLDALLHSQRWLTFISEFQGCVMLGAGSESKDRTIIEHINNSRSPAATYDYYMVDYSYYMLIHTVTGLQKFLGLSPYNVRLQRPIIADFCQLPDEFPRTSPEQKLVWFLPGGTIGNLREDDFFSSMSRAMTSGELLVVGVETLEGDPLEVRKKLKSKYDTPVLRKFVSTPIRTHWFAKNMSFDLAAAINGARIDLIEGVQEERRFRNHSKVPGAMSVAISVPIDDDNYVNVLFSTRYDEKQFIDFVVNERFGFSLEYQVDSPISPSYKQIVFRKA